MLNGSYLRIIFPIMMLLVCSCGSAQLGNGSDKVVSRSGARPKWVFERPVFSAGGNIYASGMLTDAPNLGRGLEVAAKLAQMKIVESMRLWAIDKMRYSERGLDISETDMERTFKTTTEAIMLSGLAHSRYYYEKKRASSAFGAAYRYDCFALVEISYADYLKALRGALSENISPSFAEEALGHLNINDVFPLSDDDVILEEPMEE